jgi:hypothetical protein
VPVTLPVVGSSNWGDALNAAINALALSHPQPVNAVDNADFTGLAVTTFQAGPNCGVSFTAPPSGSVYVTTSGHIETLSANQHCYLSFEVRTGSTIGSGTVFFAAITDYGVGVGGQVNNRVSSSRRKLVPGLTPGAVYNARTMHLTTGGTFNIYSRELLVEPVLSTTT